MPKSILPLVERLEIVDKNLRRHRLGSVLNWAQYEVIKSVDEQIQSNVPVRIIVLKARQMGISTVIEAILFSMAFLRQNMRGLIVSHELDSAEHLLSMTNHYWDSFLFKPLFTQKNKSAKHLSWEETQSRIRVLTAKNVGGGRSQTIQFLHASEVAFWENPKELMTGLGQTIPNQPLSFIFQESTANGIGNYFHTQWEQAKMGNIDYKPLFFPWWKHPEYTADYLRLPDKLSTRMDEEERVLYRYIQAQGYSPEQTLGKLVWRRYAIKNVCMNSLDVFHQEYPATDEEAFLSSGRHVFPLEKLADCYYPMIPKRGRLIFDGNPGAKSPGTRVRFAESDEGPLKIFRYPSDDCAYVVAGDPTRTTQGDYACIQVLNRYTWEQVAVWRMKIDPMSMADELIKLALYFNNALINTEIEGPGYATIGRLTATDYPYLWFRQKADDHTGKMEKKYGWSSTNRTKPEMIGYVIGALVDRELIIHDDQTYAEMRNYVVKDNGDYGNSDNELHDDTVTSLAIGVATMIYEQSALPPPAANRPPTVKQRVDELVEQYSDYAVGGPMDVDEDLIFGDY